MPRRPRNPIPVPSFANGWVEGASPDLTEVGTNEAVANTVPTPAGKLRTRGGSRILNTFQDDSAGDMTDMLRAASYSQIGSVAMGWISGTSKHWLFQHDADFSTQDRRDDFGWNTNGPARPLIIEMFEKLYICDGSVTYSTRHVMKRADNVMVADSPTTIQENFRGGDNARDFKPYAIEEYAGVLFAAGHDGIDATPESPSILRHSLLGSDPADAITPTPGGGAAAETSPWDVDAWAIVGAKDVPITALKKGSDILLVAKEFEIHRVWGSPLVADGFQFAQEPIDNQHGVGVSNPYALDYSGGFWYGFGKGGPFRTNGQSVELLRPFIDTTWRGFDGDEEKAWVTAYTDRELVLFGVPGGANYPSEMWIWDTRRDRWHGRWFLGTTQIFSGTGILNANPAGPSAAPHTLIAVTNSTTQFTGSWTNGDATAETELWLKDVTGGGAYMLVDTVAAADATEPFTGLVGYNHYKWKLRHKKNGQFSDFSAEQDGYTELLAPNFYAYGTTSTAGKIVIRVKQNNDGTVEGDTDIEIDRDDGAGGAYALLKTKTTIPLGVMSPDETDPTATCALDYKLRSRAKKTGWGGGDFSAYTVDEDGDNLNSACTPEPDSGLF